MRAIWRLESTWLVSFSVRIAPSSWTLTQFQRFNHGFNTSVIAGLFTTFLSAVGLTLQKLAHKSLAEARASKPKKG
jgi:hypothetical protein